MFPAGGCVQYTVDFYDEKNSSPTNRTMDTLTKIFRQVSTIFEDEFTRGSDGFARWCLSFRVHFRSSPYVGKTNSRHNYVSEKKHGLEWCVFRSKRIEPNAAVYTVQNCKGPFLVSMHSRRRICWDWPSHIQHSFRFSWLRSHRLNLSRCIWTNSAARLSHRAPVTLSICFIVITVNHTWIEIVRSRWRSLCGQIRTVPHRAVPSMVVMGGCTNVRIICSSNPFRSFPHSSAAAGSLWSGYSSDLVPKGLPSDEFIDTLDAHTFRLRQRNISSCSSGCTCDWGSSCVGNQSAFYGGVQTSLNENIVLRNTGCDVNVKVMQRSPCSKLNEDDLGVLTPNGGTLTVQGTILF